jgi:tetratricopeptide (TPR) repeat protein
MPSDFGSTALVARVRELLRAGSMDAADSLTGAALAVEPRDAEAWYARGIIANRRNDHAGAIAALREAIAIQPDASLAWLALGTAFARSVQLEEAAQAYRSVLAREPDWTDAHFNLGVVLKRQGQRLAAAHELHAAWSRDPMFFDAAIQCVAEIADCVRHHETLTPPAAADDAPLRPTFTIVVCSIDAARQARAVALYRRLFSGYQSEIVAIRHPRSLAEAYNHAAASSTADVVLMSHDDIDVLAPDFAQRLSRMLAEHDAVGVVGSTRMQGPAIGWSGHPHLRGWITHRTPGDSTWRVDVLDPRPVADGIAILDGVLLACRRKVLIAVPFDAVNFDGFHLYDLDWSYRVSRAGFRIAVTGELLLVHASRGRYGPAWQHHAERFCAKHDIGRAEPAPSSFFGATLDNPEQVRAFFAMLAQMHG